MNKTILLLLILAIGVFLFINAKPKAEMGGVVTITDIPTEVRPSVPFTIKGTFTPSADGVYLLEAGPVKCPNGCAGNVFELTTPTMSIAPGVLMADDSACDGNVHFSGVFQEMKKGVTYPYSFNLRSSRIEGDYEYAVYAYDKCGKDGGVELTTSGRKPITVSSDAPATEVDWSGNREGSVSDSFVTFYDTALATWKNMDSNIQFLLGGIMVMFVIILFAFQPPKRPR